MKSIKVCEYSRSRSFHYDLILQDQASGERSQDQWSSGSLILTLTGLVLNLSLQKFLTSPCFDMILSFTFDIKDFLYYLTFDIHRFMEQI